MQGRDAKDLGVSPDYSQGCDGHRFASGMTLLASGSDGPIAVLHDRHVNAGAALGIDQWLQGNNGNSRFSNLLIGATAGAYLWDGVPRALG
jgi:hypothetical protein